MPESDRYFCDVFYELQCFEGMNKLKIAPYSLSVFQKVYQKTYENHFPFFVFLFSRLNLPASLLNEWTEKLVLFNPISNQSLDKKRRAGVGKSLVNVAPNQ